MNILLLSSGTRNKFVQYFKKTLAGQGNVILFIGKNKGWLIATDRDVHYFSVFKSSTLISIKTLNYWTELYKKGEL